MPEKIRKKEDRVEQLCVKRIKRMADGLPLSKAAGVYAELGFGRPASSSSAQVGGDRAARIRMAVASPGRPPETVFSSTA